MRRPATQGRDTERVAPDTQGTGGRDVVILIAQLVGILMIIRLGVIGNAKIVAHSGVGVAVEPIIVSAHKKPTPARTSVVTAKLASTRIKMGTVEDALLARLACKALPVH